MDTNKIIEEYKEGFGEMVRDFTAIGFMAKSEAKRRFEKIIEKALTSQQKEFKKIVEERIEALKNTAMSGSSNYEAITELEDILKQLK